MNTNHHFEGEPVFTKTPHPFGLIDPGSAYGLIPLDNGSVSKGKASPNAEIIVSIDYEDAFGEKWTRKGRYERMNDGRQKFFVDRGGASEIERH